MKTSKEKIAATLSALGATLIAGAEARASEFTINGGAGVDVGFVNGAATTGFTMPLPGINQGIFEAITSHYAGHTYHAVNLLDVLEGSAGFNWPDFEVLDQYGEVPSEALLVGTNVYFNGATSISGRIGRLQSGPAGPTASDEYVAFRFMDGAQQYGGWAEVSILDDTYSNLTVNISEIAWQAGRLDTGDYDRGRARTRHIGDARGRRSPSRRGGSSPLENRARPGCHVTDGRRLNEPRQTPVASGWVGCGRLEGN